MDKKIIVQQYLEFGVWQGGSINFFSSKFPNSQFYGFDSFEGLPENWRPGFEKGTFSLNGMLPKVNANVKLIPGWFNESLPYFLENVNLESNVFISEKTFKPIAAMQPFIIVGSQHALKYLRKLGYKTFSPYINEHYDTIENNEDRFNAVWTEVERLCAFTDSEWLEWQKGIVDIVNYNYDVLTNKTSYLL
mgnify:CR=1 FL=1